MAYVKDKFSFSIDGVKYTDIGGMRDTNSDRILIRVAGTAQMIRQWIKNKYPKMPSKNYYWVNSNSFANGNSIGVYLNNPPDEIRDYLSTEIGKKFEYGSYHYGSQQESKDIVSKTDEGISIDYGTKYLNVTGRPPYDSSSAPSVDWSILTSSAPTSATSSTKPEGYPMGEVLKDCSGWIVSKKTLPDGRVVYNAKIKPDTPVNKDQWQEIKNEVYTQTGFKWGKFGAFEKWGVIASEAAVVDILCNILDKYYPTQIAVVQPSSSNLVFGVDIKATPQEVKEMSEIPIKTIIDRINFGYGYVEMTVKEEMILDFSALGLNTLDYLVKSTIEETKNILKDELVGSPNVLAIRPLDIDKIAEELFKYYDEMRSQTQPPLAQAQSQPQKPRNFMVGDKFYAKDYPDTKYYIKSVNSDGEVGFASLQRPDSESIYGTEDEVSELFEKGQWVKDGRYDYGQPTSEPQSPMSNGINESYKDLPANPKLEFCAINRAEGSYDDDLLPIRFQSFTALTKFIADNIGEMPPLGEGYDKYYISWKWKFEDKAESERWDVSEGDANPYKYPNLWAYNRLRNLCYDAWMINGFSQNTYSKDDDFFVNEVGKDGWEINSVEFMSLLSSIIELYPQDKKRFDYNTFKERFDRFAEVYPKLFKLFSDVETSVKSKEDIQKAINGLKYLADKGNEKAAKAVKGLQYLLNK